MLGRSHASTLISSLLAVVAAAGCSGASGGSIPAATENDDGDASATSIPSADYEKQHTLFLVNEGPSFGQMGTFSISTMRGDGTGKTLLCSDCGSPSWTPDGKIIFVSARSGSQQIYLMDADGKNVEQLGSVQAMLEPAMPMLAKNGLVSFMGADLSPERDTSGPDTNVGIWVMQRDGSGLKQIASGMQPFLAASGTWLAYTYQTDSPYHREIWRMDADGGSKQQLTFLGDADYPDANAPVISPDESTVAFFSGKESDRAGSGPMQPVSTWGHRNVAIVPATGGARKTLTSCAPATTQAELDATSDVTGNCIAADNPAWSPDGKWLVFDIGFERATETWMVDVEGHGFQKFYGKSRGVERAPLWQLN